LDAARKGRRPPQTYLADPFLDLENPNSILEVVPVKNLLEQIAKALVDNPDIRQGNW
jgi:hypothetical protein